VRADHGVDARSLRLPGCDASHGVDIDCIIRFKPAILKRNNVEPLPELLDRSRFADDPDADAPDVEHALELLCRHRLAVDDLGCLRR